MTPEKKALAEAKIYFLHGEENFLAEEFIHRMRRSFFRSAAEEDLGFTRFYLAETSWVEIIEHLRTGQLFASGPRLVLVHLPAQPDAEEGEEAKEKRLLSPVEERTLREYIREPLPEVVIIIYYSGRINKNSSIYRFFRSLDSSLWEEREFVPVKGRALQQWVWDRLRQEGKEITPDALAYLLEVTGGELRLLAAELEKLSLFVHPHRLIDTEAVAALCPSLRTYLQYELSQAMEEGAKGRAFRILAKLMEEMPRREYIVGVFVQFFRELQMAHAWLEKGKQEDFIFGELRPMIKPNFSFYRERRDNFFRTVACFGQKELTTALAKLRSLDQAIKSGAALPGVGLEEFLHWYFERREGKVVRAIYRSPS